MTVTLEAMRELLKCFEDNICKKYDDIIKKKEEECSEKFSELKERYEKIEIEVEGNRNKIVKENVTLPNVEINYPRFYGNNRDVHPKIYLRKLEKYFERKSIYEEDKLLIVEESLKQNASNWYSIVNYLCNDYESFKVLFLEEFWSRDIQLNVWSQFSMANRVNGIKSYREYFGSWVQKVKYLDFLELNESEIINIIAKHFPGYIQAILVSMPIKSFMEATNLLGREDAYNNNYNNDQNINKNTEDEPNPNNTFYRNKPYVHNRNAGINGERWGNGNNDRKPNNSQYNKNNTRYEHKNKLSTNDYEVKQMRVEEENTYGEGTSSEEYQNTKN